MRNVWLVAVLTVAVTSAARAVSPPVNDYPTTARADYIFACMQVNGPTRDSLEKCSCSIDAIAALLSYDEYEAAKTIMEMSQTRNRNTELFHSYGPFKEKVLALKRAQVEGELRCF